MDRRMDESLIIIIILIKLALVVSYSELLSVVCVLLPPCLLPSYYSYISRPAYYLKYFSFLIHQISLSF
jgi:hypothetical protein